LFVVVSAAVAAIVAIVSVAAEIVFVPVMCYAN